MERVLRAFFHWGAFLSAHYTLPKDFTTTHVAAGALLQGRLNWKSYGAVVGLCGGLSAPIVGSFVTVISWLIDPVWHGVSLHAAGTSLFVLTVPLLVFGAHCLDLLDKEERLMHAPQQTEKHGNRDQTAICRQSTPN